MELTAARGALTSQVLCPQTLLCSLKIKDGSHGSISLSERKGELIKDILLFKQREKSTY